MWQCEIMWVWWIFGCSVMTWFVSWCVVLSLNIYKGALSAVLSLSLSLSYLFVFARHTAFAQHRVVSSQRDIADVTSDVTGCGLPCSQAWP